MQASIATYLEHLGGGLTESRAERGAAASLRPRSSKTAPAATPRLSASDRAFPIFPKLGEEHRAATPWPRKLAPTGSVGDKQNSADERLKTQETAQALAEAHARGRAEGLAEGRVEAEEARARDRAAEREQAAHERLDFQRNEYAKLEASLRSGFAELEQTIGATVARILSPFLADQAARRAVDELRACIHRLFSTGPRKPIVVRGPERLLALLRDRLADLPLKVAFIEDAGAEAVVEADPTEIETQLGAFAELLNSLEG